MEPKHDPVERHAEMTQIPSMKKTGDLKGLSTSALQGHGVDEPEALELAKQMSLSDLEAKTRAIHARAQTEYDEAMSIAQEPDLFTKLMGYADFVGKKTRPLEEWKIEEQELRSREKFQKLRAESARRQGVVATFRQERSAPSTPTKEGRQFAMKLRTPVKPPFALEKTAAQEVADLQKLLKLSGQKTPLTARSQMEFTALKGDYPFLKGQGPRRTRMEIQRELVDAQARLASEEQRIFSRPSTPTPPPMTPSVSEEKAAVSEEKVAVPEEKAAVPKAAETAPTTKRKMPRLVMPTRPQTQPIAPPILHGPSGRPAVGRRRRVYMSKTHPVPTISPTIQWEEDYRRKIGWGSRIWGVMDLLTGEQKQAKRQRRRIIVPMSDF